MRITIEEAENGIVVSRCYGEDMAHEDDKYVYKTIDQAAKALPGIFSVSEAEAPEEDEKSLKKLKSKLPKGDY
jgi:hypothetical protein